MCITDTDITDEEQMAFRGMINKEGERSRGEADGRGAGVRGDVCVGGTLSPSTQHRSTTHRVEALNSFP
jgi:hypothetical protein